MNLLEIGLSFLEGLALIASPCILPVLPLVLSTSVAGGRRRPFGIILGFVIAFTAFAMFSRKLVMALGIDLDIIKYGSLVFLALFGLVLLSDTLSTRFSNITQRFAGAGSSFSANAKDGFGSGILIGLLIGLVWTPCAGPLLAAVLVQVIRQESDIEALFLVASFAFGAGLPMLIIALTGRKLITRLGFFTTHAEAVRKGFGVLILLAVAFIASGIDPQTLFSKAPLPTTALSTNSLADPLPNAYPAPDFAGIEAWLNSKPLTMASLKGKVVLIDFWTYSCINCVRTLPYITKWDQQYRDQGLVIIGVHSPEFEFEKNQANVKAAIARRSIQYPVALDNKLDTWTNFSNKYWPAHYLINQQGQVVYLHYGEGHYAETENNIRYLLGLNAKAATAVEASVSNSNQTPETYLGYDRATQLKSPEIVSKDTPQTYNLPASLATNQWALAGRWQVKPEHIMAAEAGAALQLRFTAKKVFLVLGTRDGTLINATLKLNGQPLNASTAGSDVENSAVAVGQHTIYELVNQQQAVEGLLEITADALGLEAYAFTFGN